jgi:hypothetical protein
MSSLLEANRDVNILLEYWPVGLQRCGAAPRELLERLLSRGFALYELQNEGVEPARPEELLRKYTVESRKYTNLYCTRRPQSWLELNDLWLDQFQGGWWKKLRDATRRLSALIPPGEKFILVDDARLGDDCLLPDRTAIPFNERNGVFWGPPRDDEEAIAEFRRLLNTGAGFLVFAWPSYWWLEHYKQLAELVRVRFPCIVEDESLVVFDLRGMTAKLAAAYAAELDA